MSTTKIHYNISAQTCRVCLETPQAEGESTLCLRDEIEYNDLKVELWQLLEAVSKVKCTGYDSLWPTQMCQNCTRRLIVAYEFMREVEKSQQILQGLYENEKLDQNGEMTQDEPQVLQIETDDETVIESEQGFNTESHAEQQRLENSQSPRVFDKSESLKRPQSGGAAHSQTDATEDTMLTCQHCPRIFKRQEGLHRHYLEHHPGDFAITNYEQSSLQAFVKSIGQQESRLSECKICSKRFISQNRLTRHMRFHTEQRSDQKIYGRCHGSEGTFQCNKQESLQLKARSLHEPVTKPHPYKCGVCGMDFKSGALLTVHRNNMSHYNYENVNYGDPFGERQKKQQGTRDRLKNK